MAVATTAPFEHLEKGKVMKTSINVHNSGGPRAVLNSGKDAVTEKAMLSRNGREMSASHLGASKKLIQVLASVFLIMALAVLSGCSSSSSGKPEVGSITFTDANGTAQTPLTSLTVSSSAYLDVTLTNDKELLGADWTASCGSEPPLGTPLPPGETVDDSCGTFTPVHTMSGPVPDYATSAAGYVTLYTSPSAPPVGGAVTLYVTATSDPSVYSIVTLPVVGLPIVIGFAPAPPATLAVSGSTPLKAVLTNDYAAGGVNWTVTCSSSACGSLGSTKTASGTATTYTAPAAVPAGNTVAVFATSVTDPTKAVSANITILPITVSVEPSALSVPVSETGTLNATVTNDVGSLGVDWTLSCESPGACGSITPHTASGGAATYTAPTAAPTGTATITATSSSDKTTFATATVTVSATQSAITRKTASDGVLAISEASVPLDATRGSGYGSARTIFGQLQTRYEESF